MHALKLAWPTMTNIVLFKGVLHWVSDHSCKTCSLSRYKDVGELTLTYAYTVEAMHCINGSYSRRTTSSQRAAQIIATTDLKF